MPDHRHALGASVFVIALAVVAWARPTRDGWWLLALAGGVAAVVLALVAANNRESDVFGLVAAFLLSVGGVGGLLLGAIDSSSAVMPGRPLRRRRRVVLPSLAGSPVRRDWAEAARGEHASVPAFAKVSLDLAAVGAPLELHERVHRAAIEEVEHTRRALALAGPGVDIGPLPGRRRTLKLARLAVETLRDGCVGEGDAAEDAAAATATSDEERAALGVIARDEAGHAELAWAILTWCLATGGPTVHAVVRRELRRLRDHPDVVARATALLNPAG